jgi:hypothetical protein
MSPQADWSPCRFNSVEKWSFLCLVAMLSSVRMGPYWFWRSGGGRPSSIRNKSVSKPGPGTPDLKCGRAGGPRAAAHHPRSALYGAECHIRAVWKES